ncbi:MAG: dTDP-4-dehydrorhamnose 3,5-epimerase family protein [Hyphomicrobium sp.]|uniref:dTDP-4-dehydrorhamnose 3,5-epimerase family protein n=1 Tax=Hyphomicrobium sp. TaxID=82 RepID=UPI001328318E|nr:dTDP-4-dehydrorhamnose 3,5-epimerase family protein [Hyphomicrobium sp.]KAB2939029.1 MAG: dTDP-4-keto-6-deoxy-D-glucose epimerase [Hyphomicrobium sp.]MBZ0211762.1 dTDP-4-dehydrorhamnose 3,5-epimerase family protein [Hyphomicrobium sp.]
MRLIETPLHGAFVVEIDKLEDQRGFFARTFCAREFETHGLAPCVAQCSISFNSRRDTLRGMHFQSAPHEEDKLVRCTRGALWDVIIDLRPQSATRNKWFAKELTADNCCAMYVPKGFAHGFKTLRDATEVLYQMSTPFVSGAASGVRWNDPAFAIDWPGGEPILSPRDAAYPDYGS